MLGFTFKENCPDLRNTRVIDLVREFNEFGVQVDIHDPWADSGEIQSEYGIETLPELPQQADYDAVVIAVGHDAFRSLGAQGMRALIQHKGVLYDIKGLFSAEQVDGRL